MIPGEKFFKDLNSFLNQVKYNIFRKECQVAQGQTYEASLFNKAETKMQLRVSWKFLLVTALF